MLKKSLVYIALFLAVIIVVYIILNIDLIKGLIFKVRSAVSLVKLIKEETGFKKVSAYLNFDPKRDQQGLTIVINDNYAGDIKKMAEKVQIIAFDNYPQELDYIEVIYKKPLITIKGRDSSITYHPGSERYYLSRQQIKQLKKERAEAKQKR